MGETFYWSQGYKASLAIFESDKLVSFRSKRWPEGSLSKINFTKWRLCRMLITNYGILLVNRKSFWGRFRKELQVPITQNINTRLFAFLALD